MWCIDNDEARRWCLGCGIPLDEKAAPILQEGRRAATFSLSESWSKLTWLSRQLTSYLEPFDECLLWVTLWGVWASSENLHLFYRLRDSCGEHRQLSEAPGHLFLGHETADLATFIELGLTFGWDFYLLLPPATKAVFASHDEALDFYLDPGPADSLEAVKAWFADAPRTAADGEA